jgi:hypothetical protein
MAHRLKTPEGRALYALRKQTPEPVESSDAIRAAIFLNCGPLRKVTH